MALGRELGQVCEKLLERPVSSLTFTVCKWYNGLSLLKPADKLCRFSRSGFHLHATTKEKKNQKCDFHQTSSAILLRMRERGIIIFACSLKKKLLLLWKTFLQSIVICTSCLRRRGVFWAQQERSNQVCEPFPPE